MTFAERLITKIVVSIQDEINGEPPGRRSSIGYYYDLMSDLNCTINRWLAVTLK